MCNEKIKAIAIVVQIGRKERNRTEREGGGGLVEGRGKGETTKILGVVENFRGGSRRAGPGQSQRE